MGRAEAPLTCRPRSLRSDRMRLHILSDIHLESGGYDPADVEADAIVLAGDIGTGKRGVALTKLMLRKVARRQ